jgi:acyl-CoA synthetase (AMP-forming)/AMP-acid ligase II
MDSNSIFRLDAVGTGAGRGLADRAGQSEGPGPGEGEATMVDVLRRWAAQVPTRRAFTFLRAGELEAGTLSFGDLDRGARAVAARLHGLDAGGGRALLLYPAGLDFVVAFFGCLYAGVTPVPVSLPNRQRGIVLLQAILQDCRACCMLSSSP